MKRTFRKLLVLLVAAALLFGLSSCFEFLNQTTETTTVRATEPKTEPATTPATEPKTEPATTPATEPATTPVTEPKTEPATTPATATETAPLSEPGTEPATAPESGPVATGETTAEGTGEAKPKGEIGGNLQIHFIELGNYYTGDCVYIKAGETDILIDAGSKYSSVPTIAAYLNEYVTDNTLEYVIVTHAHEDHYAGFAASEGIFDLYECGVIIDFAQTNQKETAKMYSNYIAKRDAEIAAGATHYTALDCIEQGKTDFAVAEGINMKILNSYYYANKDSSGENNHSVCMLLTEGENNYLFTGDLEAKGEKKLVEMNDLPHVVLYKAGHHGSKTSSSDELLSVITPEIVCVCCCAGSSEYTKTEENKFPTQAFVDRIAPHTRRVYVTTISVSDEDKTFQSMNGNITVCSDGTEVWVVCSASDLVLCETAWFEEKRTRPAAWQN